MYSSSEFDISKEKNKKSSVMQIVDAIKQMLIDEKFKVGDKIPTEPELSERFGKSRGSIREAVKILESFGVLDVRKGDGTYITASASSGMFDALFFRIIAMGTNFSEVVQLRIILESAIVDLIISKGISADIKEIEEANANLEKAIDAEAKQEVLIQLDRDFHNALARASGNELLCNVYLNMMEIFAPFIRNSYVQQRENKEYFSVYHHRAIIQSINEHDYDLAHYAVKKSMRDWSEQNMVYLNIGASEQPKI